jgi:glucose/arabinose dehydrogenase
MAVTKLLIAATALAAALLTPVQAQTPKPKPAFPGQTDAPAPAKASPAINLETIASGLSAPWSCAFLPDGRFLITESGGTMRIVRADGVIGAPIAGVPPVKSVAAQGLHDDLFIGAMAGHHLVRLILNGNRVMAEEKLLTDLNQRIREVRQAPDGSVYIFAGASLMRLTPKK